MLNVIPPQQKIGLQKEYSRRRNVIWLVGLIFSLSVSLILLLPSYLLTRLKAAEVKSELEHSQQVLNNELLPEDVSKELSAAIGHAEALRPFKEDISPYDLIKIFETKPKTVKISDILFSKKDSSTGLVLTVKGVAADRDSLTEFSESLRGRPEFASVDLPVSNFVKEQDLDFSMTIKLKK